VDGSGVFLDEGLAQGSGGVCLKCVFLQLKKSNQGSRDSKVDSGGELKIDVQDFSVLTTERQIIAEVADDFSHSLMIG
jgi:hypothetical protein